MAGQLLTLDDLHQDSFNQDVGVFMDHGKLFKANREGRLFVARSDVAGIALIVSAATGGHPTLWNKASSKYDLNVVKLELGYVSGNNAPTSLQWAYTKNASDGPGVLFPIKTATLVAVESGVPGENADDPDVNWSPTTNTFLAAPTYYKTAGVSLFTGVAATAVAPFQLSANYDGEIVLRPGVALSLCAVAATTTALFQIAITYEKVLRRNPISL